MAKRKRGRVRVVVLICLILSGFVVDGVRPAQAKKRIELNRKKLTLYVGQKKKLKLKNYKKKVTWKSKKKKVATVSKTGWVKGQKAGKTTVSGTYKYKGRKRTKKCAITVKSKTNKTEIERTPALRVTPVPTAAGTPAVTKSPEPKVLQLDFEDGKNESMTGRQGEELLTIEEGGYHDMYCLKVSNRLEEWAGPQIRVTSMVSGFAGYRVEAYVKQTSGGNRTINCMWQSTDDTGVTSYDKIHTVSAPSGSWVKIDTTVMAPGNVSQIYLYFEMPGDTRDFYVDNITLTEHRLGLDEVQEMDSLKDAYADRFPIGCSINSHSLDNPKILAFLKHHYSAVTFDNELKPENLLDQEKSKASEEGMPGIHMDRIDKCLKPAQENNLKVRFHTLVWYSQTPDWYFCENYEPAYDGKGTGKKNITNLVDQATMMARMESYITQIITYVETKYPGTVYAYDVVNEAIHGSKLKLRTGPDSLYGAIFTGDDPGYITAAFRCARAVQERTSSHARLFYNDYVGAASQGQRNAVVRYLADARAAGTIDGIGMQAHLTNPGAVDEENFRKAVICFSENGYEVQITELDFANRDNSELGNETLAAAYRSFMTMLFQCMDQEHAGITNFTMWNLTDRDTWLNDYYNDGRTCYPSVFDADYMPKPAYYALLELAKVKS